MKHRLVHLDFLRGMAALLVCAEHLRAFLMVNYEHVKNPAIGNRIFYFSTALGHQAVMIFFVLSGYFVGGSVIGAYEEKKWSWSRYASRRLSRLWVVLVPALILTLIWDEIGRNVAQAGYNGSFHNLYCSGPAFQAPADLRAVTFFGNCFFLQTICVPAFGTNSPLWSLANEFWYYVLFPLALGVFKQTRLAYKVLSCLLATGIIVSLPSAILWGGIVWLFGVAAYLAVQNNLLKRACSHPLWLTLTGGLAMMSLLASKVLSQSFSNLAIGITVAMFVAGLAARQSPFGTYAQVAAGMGETSYTLYVAHFPFLAFIFFVFFKGSRCQPDFIGFAEYIGIFSVTLAYAAIVWWCFERNTDSIRKFLETKLHSSSRIGKPVARHIQ